MPSKRGHSIDVVDIDAENRFAVATEARLPGDHIGRDDVWVALVDCSESRQVDIRIG